jgi:hypothetical protein
MTVGWNFERRRDTCTRFILGVSVLTEHTADKPTNLEAVRNRMGLSPEEALFAARQLASKNLITFDPVGSIRSSARGIEHAATLADALRASLGQHSDVVLALADGGARLAVIAALVRFDGGATACPAPEEEPSAAYRLTFAPGAAKKEAVGLVVVERQREDGTFGPA